jgi:SAM-dependent methyltransferase
MTWYRDWFGEDYLRVYPHRDSEEARAQVDAATKLLPLSREDTILDLGCGNGRHAVELAKRGYHVACLDLSMVLLRLARKNSKAYPLSFIRADMRHMPFTGAFDVVVSFFTTFGYFDSDSENLQTLLSMANALRPGGKFLQDYLNKPFVIDNIVPYDESKRHGMHIVQERQYNRRKERIEKKITIRSSGEVREYFESVRLYTLEEMDGLIAKTDLELQRTCGDFDGRPYAPTSPRLILLGSRRR